MALFLFLCFVLCATAGTAHKLHKRNSDVDPECLQAKLVVPRIDPTAWRIPVSWKHFEPKSECVQDGAKYIIRVAWSVRGKQNRTEEISSAQDKYDIAGLGPYTRVDIYVTLCYVDKGGHKHCGETHEWMTSTRESNPSKPLNFNVSDTDLMTYEFQPPESPNGPVTGYRYEACKVESCDQVAVRRYCGQVKSVKSDERSFSIEDLDPLQYYKLLLWAYTSDLMANRELDGDYSELCIRTPPSGVEPVTDLRVKCNKDTKGIEVRWKLPSTNRPEGYKVAVVKGPTSQDEHPERRILDVTIGTSCKDDVCSYTVPPPHEIGHYHVEVFPFYKDVTELHRYATYEACFLVPPPPDKTIRVVDDPGLEKTQQAIEIPVDLLEELKVPPNKLELLVAQDSEIDNCKFIPDTWNVAHSHDPITCYRAMPSSNKDDSRYCKESGKVMRCVLGVDHDCELCNGPLKVGVRYGVKVMTYGQEQQFGSKAAFFTAGTPTGDPGEFPSAPEQTPGIEATSREAPVSTNDASEVSTEAGGTDTDATEPQVPSSTARPQPSTPGSSVRTGGSYILIVAAVALVART